MSNMQAFYTNLVQSSKQTEEVGIVNSSGAATAVFPQHPFQQALFQLTHLTLTELDKKTKNQIGWSGWWITDGD